MIDQNKQKYVVLQTSIVTTTTNKFRIDLILRQVEQTTRRELFRCHAVTVPVSVRIFVVRVEYDGYCNGNNE